MKILVTGSTGHLGEALMRHLSDNGHEAIGIDRLPSRWTHRVGSIADRAFVASCMPGIEAVLHTATLHKPHVATHSIQDFIDTNITGTLNLLEEAVPARVASFVFTSTTSAFGRALTPPDGAPAAWVTEDVAPVPKNIYGVTKIAAEGICELVQRRHGMPCIVLRTSRFFPESDDQKAMREAYDGSNSKVNEYLNRRVDIEDVLSAHLCAIERGPSIGFGRYIISATTPFRREECVELRTHLPAVVARHVPEFEAEYARRGWSMFPGIDRVYVNERARAELGWQPRHDFRSVVERLRAGGDHRSPLAEAIGAKGYHPQTFEDGPYPVHQ